MTPPKAFISYAHNDLGYKEKVLQFALRLREEGVDVILDQWHLRPGQDMNHFMERSVRDADKVLLLLDPTYKQKADGRTGGVGIETQIVSAEVYENTDNTKFIPVLFELRGTTSKQCTPMYLKTRVYANLANPDEPEKEFDGLVRGIFDVEPDLPPLGVPRYPTPATTRSKVLAALVTMQNSLTEDFNLIREMMATPPGSWTILDSEVEVHQALDDLEAGEWIEQRITRRTYDDRGPGKVVVLVPRGKLTKLLTDREFIREFNQVSRVKAAVLREISLTDTISGSDSGTVSPPAPARLEE